MKSASAVSLVIAVFLDLLLIAAFALIGRASHGESLAGVAVTAWPFIVGLAVGWAISLAWLHPFRVRWTGLIIWPVTVIIGLLCRLSDGQGAQVSFVIVTTIVLGVFLLGWRTLVTFILRRRVSTARTAAESHSR